VTILRCWFRTAKPINCVEDSGPSRSVSRFPMRFLALVYLDLIIRCIMDNRFIWNKLSFDEVANRSRSILVNAYQQFGTRWMRLEMRKRRRRKVRRQSSATFRSIDRSKHVAQTRIRRTCGFVFRVLHIRTSPFNLIIKVFIGHIQTGLYLCYTCHTSNTALGRLPCWLSAFPTRWKRAWISWPP